MAYKSKEKLLELGTGKFSYCTVDPKKGTPCKKHFHAEQIALKGKEAERLRELGEELISIADSATGQEELTSVGPEDIYTVLGMPQVYPVPQEEANKFLDDQTELVETGIVDKTDFGKWLAPNPEFGNPKCDCGRPLEIRALKDGRRVWHHVDHAELDSYTGFYDEEDRHNFYNTLAYDPNYWSEEDIAMVELNAGVGSRYWDQTEFAFAPISDEVYYDGKEEGHSWKWVPDTEARRYGANHPTVPAKNCLHCGSQNLESKTLRSGFLNLAKDTTPTLVCNNCGAKAESFN